MLTIAIFDVGLWVGNSGGIGGCVCVGWRDCHDGAGAVSGRRGLGEMLVDVMPDLLTERMV